MPLNPSGSGPKKISVVLAYGSDDAEAFPGLLESSRRCLAHMKISSEWIVVCRPGQEPQAQAQLKKLGAHVIEAASGSGNWPAFYEGALRASSEWLLLQPGSLPFDAPLAKKMLAAAAGHDWVGSSRGRQSYWLRSFLYFFSGARHSDLSAACLLKREWLLSCAAQYSSQEALFGYRVFSRACASQMAYAEVSPEGADQRLSLWQSLGLDPISLGSSLRSTANWSFQWALMLLAGLALANSLPAVGLALIASAAFLLASLLGKPE